MNVKEARRKLEGLGAPMDWICIVPLDSKMAGWKRAEKANLIETADGFLVAGYERAKVFGAASFDNLDAACRKVARDYQQLEQRQQEALERKQRPEQ